MSYRKDKKMLKLQNERMRLVLESTYAMSKIFQDAALLYRKSTAAPFTSSTYHNEKITSVICESKEFIIKNDDGFITVIGEK